MPAGGIQRLSADDAQILRLESEAIKGHTAKLAIVEPGPGGLLGAEALRERVAAGLERMPRARQRVVFRTPDPDAVWQDDPDFDLSSHVVAHRAAGPIDRERLRAIASTLMAERLDHSRPLWRLDLVGPLEAGGSAIVMRIHHAMADGIAALRFTRAVLWDEDETDEEGLAGRGRDAAPGAERSWRRRAGTLARMPAALARELTPRAPRSALDRHIGTRRELAFARAALADLKRIEGAARDRLGRKVTVNDVFLAALAGGLRRWLRASPAPRLRVKVPVSMHHRSERPDELGNRDSFLFVDLPLDEADPLRRLDRIGAETAKRKLRGDAAELYAFFHGVGHLPALGRLGTRLTMSPHEFSLAASNVAGPRRPVSVLGRRVSELYSIAEPADRHALRVTALSCAGTMGFGLCSDPDALSGLERLAAGIDRAVAELLDRA